MGGLCRHPVMQAGWDLVQVHFSKKREKNVSPDTCAAGVATQGTDDPTVMRFCVQLLHERGASEPTNT